VLFIALLERACPVSARGGSPARQSAFISQHYGAREHSMTLYASFLSKNVICVKCMDTCIKNLTQTRDYIVPVLRGVYIQEQ
jgi:hypothetical protein